jgi:hypothetical protein
LAGSSHAVARSTISEIRLKVYQNMRIIGRIFSGNTDGSISVGIMKTAQKAARMRRRVSGANIPAQSFHSGS